MHFTTLSREQASSGLAAVSAGKHGLHPCFPLLSHYCVNYDTTPHPRPRPEAGNGWEQPSGCLFRSQQTWQPPDKGTCPTARPGPDRRGDPRAAPEGCLLLTAPSRSHGTRAPAFAGRPLPLGGGRGQGETGLQTTLPPSINKTQGIKSSFTDMSDHRGQTPGELLGGHFFFQPK